MKSLKSYLLAVLLICSLAGYLIVSYGIKRSNFGAFIAIYALLFVLYVLMQQQAGSRKKCYWLIGAAILFRLVLIFAIPNLSDDFNRFIWDGRLLVHGINPFAHTPKFYMQHGLPPFLSAPLFQHLNSQPYYTVYPPVSQYIYGLGAFIGGTKLLGNVVVMKTVMAAAEIGSFWVMKKLLAHFKLPLTYLLLYALNPLIILELTGNLHFEGVMIFFLLLSYLLFLKKRWWAGALCFTLAVNTKLVPLILLPYLVFSVGWKRSAQIIGVVIVGTGLLFIPFIDATFIRHFSDSLGLYFHSFEYNASIFYLVRWIGFKVEGYDIIHSAVPVLSIISTILIVGVSWRCRRTSLNNLPAVYIIVLAVYYLFSTTVHPWYAASLVAFVPLAGLWFPVAWSALIPLTYITYITPDYHQNFWLISVEYIIVFGVMAYDFYQRKKTISKKIEGIYSSDFTFIK